MHYNGGGLRLRRWVVAHGLLRGRVVAALGRRLKARLGRRVVLVLLGVAHGPAGCWRLSSRAAFLGGAAGSPHVEQASLRVTAAALVSGSTPLARPHGNAPSCLLSPRDPPRFRDACPPLGAAHAAISRAKLRRHTTHSQCKYAVGAPEYEVRRSAIWDFTRSWGSIGASNAEGRRMRSLV